MTYLIATGPHADDQAEWHIPEPKTLMLGRSDENDIAVPWDTTISRTHAEFQIRNHQVTIRCFPNIRNQILFEDLYYSEVTLTIGQEFRIGQTVFHTTDGILGTQYLTMLDDFPEKDSSQTKYFLSPTDVRIELVSKHVPDLWLSQSERKLTGSVINILKQVMRHADVVAVVEKKHENHTPEVIRWGQPDKKDEQAIIHRPLIRDVFRKSESVTWVETGPESEPIESGRWAFSVPVKVDAPSRWCLYICGRFGERTASRPFMTTEDFKDDVNLVELLAQMLGAIRRVRMLEDRFSGIQQFFSPAVIKVVSKNDSHASMEPTENDTAVLFCDLRGFSKLSEQANEDLHQFLERCNNALGVMTQSIIGQNGVIADFQGDSALGFWGWPLPLSEGSLPACRAALRILRLFRTASRSRNVDLKGFQVGIGITRGKAIAGKIGTQQQAKVGVFGPVVNLASRLEGLTKQVGVPALIDQSTADQVREQLPAEEGRVRKIATVRPIGFDSAMQIFELLPPEQQSNISNQNILDFEAAVAAFESGEWDSALELLGHLPPKDRAKDYLLMHIATQNYQPPTGWDGVISVTKK